MSIEYRVRLIQRDGFDFCASEADSHISLFELIQILPSHFSN
jgi:hypothetical protein